MIVVSGEALVDLVPRPQSDNLYEAILGGSPYNVAIGLGRLGAPVAFAGRLSTDANGDRFAAALTRDGVGLQFVERTREPTPLALVAPGTAASGPRYAFYLRGTAYDGHPPLPSHWPPSIVHLHTGSIAALDGASGIATLLALRAARGHSSTSFDPNIRPVILPERDSVLPLVEERVGLSTFVRASEEDLQWLYPDRAPEASAAEWATLGPQFVILTRGAAGAQAFIGADQISVAAPRVEVVDTIGAGDSFTAALIAAMLDDRALGPEAPAPTLDGVRRWLEFACKVAAITSSRKGADPPRRSELVSGLK